MSRGHPRQERSALSTHACEASASGARSAPISLRMVAAAWRRLQKSLRMRPRAPPSSNSPEPAQRIERILHALGGGGIGLRAASPAERIAHLLERDFPAHRRFQNVGADLADGFDGLTVALAMEELVLTPRHAGEAAEIGGEDAVEVD